MYVDMHCDLGLSGFFADITADGELEGPFGESIIHMIKDIILMIPYMFAILIIVMMKTLIYLSHSIVVFLLFLYTHNFDLKVFYVRIIIKTKERSLYV